MRRPGAGRARRLGSTTIEVLLTAGLLAMLAALLGATWRGFGRPAIDGILRSRLTHEASLAAESLAIDLGGSLADAPAVGNAKDDWKLVGLTHPGDARLWLCYDGGAPTNGAADWDLPDAVVTYDVQSGALVRTNLATGAAFTVARHVESLEVTDYDDHRYQVKLTLSYRGLTRTYLWVVTDQL